MRSTTLIQMLIIMMEYTTVHLHVQHIIIFTLIQMLLMRQRKLNRELTKSSLTSQMKRMTVKTVTVN